MALLDKLDGLIASGQSARRLESARTLDELLTLSTEQRLALMLARDPRLARLTREDYQAYLRSLPINAGLAHLREETLALSYLEGAGGEDGSGEGGFGGHAQDLDSGAQPVNEYVDSLRRRRLAGGGVGGAAAGGNYLPGYDPAPEPSVGPGARTGAGAGRGSGPGGPGGGPGAPLASDQEGGDRWEARRRAARRRRIARLAVAAGSAAGLLFAALVLVGFAGVRMVTDREAARGAEMMTAIERLGGHLEQVGGRLGRVEARLVASESLASEHQAAQIRALAALTRAESLRVALLGGGAFAAEMAAFREVAEPPPALWSRLQALAGFGAIGIPTLDWLAGELEAQRRVFALRNALAPTLIGRLRRGVEAAVAGFGGAGGPGGSDSGDLEASDSGLAAAQRALAAGDIGAALQAFDRTTRPELQAFAAWRQHAAARAAAEAVADELARFPTAALTLR